MRWRGFPCGGRVWISTTAPATASARIYPFTKGRSEFRSGSAALEPGMILSNEPGFYHAGHWGIRIENLVVVERREIAGAEREMLGFATLTLAPLDLALRRRCEGEFVEGLRGIEPNLLDGEEIAWMDAYHARVRGKFRPSSSQRCACGSAARRDGSGAALEQSNLGGYTISCQPLSRSS